MVGAEPARPGGEARTEAIEDRRPHVEFDPVALAIIEAQGFDMGEPLQRPGEAGRGILPARKEHDGAGGVLSGHHAIPRNLWVCSPRRQRGFAMQ